MKLYSAAPGAVLALLFLAPPAPKSAASSDSYLPLPAQVVAGPFVSRADWSSDGRYVLAVRDEVHGALPSDDTPPDESLIAWSVTTHKATEVWRASAGSGTIIDVGWLPGTGVALVTEMEKGPDGSSVRQLLRVDARRGGATVLTALKDQEYVFVSPVLPTAALISAKPNESTVRMVALNGTIDNAVAVPEGVSTTGQWSQDGRRLLLIRIERTEIAGAKPTVKRIWSEFDPATGAMTALDKEPPDAPTRAPAKTVDLISTQATLPDSKPMRTIHPLWLQQKGGGPADRTLLSPDSEKFELAPKGDAVLYLSQGAAWVVPLQRVSGADMAAMKQDAERKRAVSNGKLVGLALMMYSADYDDVMPAPGTPISDTVDPYVKDASLVDPANFVYTGPGGKLADIQNPAGTVIGYVPSVGGRAVVYADGHVQWQDDGK